MTEGEENELCFGDVEFEMPIGHPVEKAVGNQVCIKKKWLVIEMLIWGSLTSSGQLKPRMRFTKSPEQKEKLTGKVPWETPLSKRHT